MFFQLVHSGNPLALKCEKTVTFLAALSARETQRGRSVPDRVTFPGRPAALSGAGRVAAARGRAEQTAGAVEEKAPEPSYSVPGGSLSAGGTPVQATHKKATEISVAFMRNVTVFPLFYVVSVN
ncbi:hypothetical protein NDU88_007363 [Pleurodeles waltl]|uniref:Uncharacterized protein n=1 Tax=Pleurodeles waltl TaxID=8319 RepID=A0AAV7NWG5_PLEWA|nr:hypothetical protein NDU88_007363 [Pleurodeles waltl]